MLFHAVTVFSFLPSHMAISRALWANGMVIGEAKLTGNYKICSGAGAPSQLIRTQFCYFILGCEYWSFPLNNFSLLRFFSHRHTILCPKLIFFSEHTHNSVIATVLSITDFCTCVICSLYSLLAACRWALPVNPKLYICDMWSMHAWGSMHPLRRAKISLLCNRIILLWSRALYYYNIIELASSLIWKDEYFNYYANLCIYILRKK